MSRSRNLVILLGNIGKDAEMTYTTGGQAVSKFSLATARSWKGKDGEQRSETEWHAIVLWGKTAEALTQYLTKGSQVYVEGYIKSRTWEGKDGAKHYATDIVAEEIVLLGGKSEGAPAKPAQKPVRKSEPVDDDSIPF